MNGGSTSNWTTETCVVVWPPKYVYPSSVHTTGTIPAVADCTGITSVLYTPSPLFRNNIRNIWSYSVYGSMASTIIHELEVVAFHSRSGQE